MYRSAGVSLLTSKGEGYSLVVVVQLVSGHALVPKRFGIGFVSRRRNPPFYRAMIHAWIALTILVAVVICWA